MKKLNFNLIIILIIIFIGLIINIIFFISEPITDKLEATCEAYDMIYIYHEGPGCLDNQNVLHRIHYDCPEPYERGLCDIRFIKTKGSV